MDRVAPETLSGPRAYFTDFDHLIVARTGNLETLRQKGERKLKALLLLKGQVVCAASHLASRFAYEFFVEHPILLTSSAIVPALRSDKTELSELFTRKRFPEKDSAVQFYRDHIQKTVNWELCENSMWFRDRFLADLEDEQSVIRRNLSESSHDTLSQLVSEIRQGALLGRELIEKYAKPLPRNSRRLLLNYRELLYHISGARVVNCESALPQENYIDYDLADLQQKRVRLSEDQILSKLLLELVFDSMQKWILPVEILDMLTFEDIMLIRQPLLDSTFQKKYDLLIHKAMSSYSVENDKIYDIYELERIHRSLSVVFNSVLQEELPKYLKKKAIEQSKQLASVTSSVALGLAGVVPGIGIIASAVSLMKDSPALLVNLSQTYSSIKTLSKVGEQYQRKENLLRKEIEKTSISDKTVFYEMVSLLLRTISNRIKI